MRIELLNVECEFQVPVVFGRRNVYVTTVDTAASTSDMNNIAFRLCAMGYQSIHVTSQRTGNNETKAYPTIRICLPITLTGDFLFGKSVIRQLRDGTIEPIARKYIFRCTDLEIV